MNAALRPASPHTAWSGILKTACLALAALVLAGCATTRNVDSEVRSFAGPQAVPAGASYRFERLPSQTAKTQDPLERAAQHVLNAKSLVRKDDQPAYSVQLRLERDTVTPNSPYRAYGSPFSDRVVMASDGTLWRRVGRPLLDPIWYRNSLQVVVRDLASSTVAFETRAVHEGPWSDIENLMAPLMEAALRDFPQGNPGPNTIIVELPPTPAKP